MRRKSSSLRLPSAREFHRARAKHSSMARVALSE
jgi:hypothetical protein